MTNLNFTAWILQSLAIAWMLSELFSSVAISTEASPINFLKKSNSTDSNISIKKITNTSIEYFEDIGFTYLLPPKWNASLSKNSNASISLEAMLFFPDSSTSFETYAMSHNALQRALARQKQDLRKSLLVAYPRHSMSSVLGMDGLVKSRVEFFSKLASRRHFNISKLWVSGHGMGGINIVESSWYEKAINETKVSGIMLFGCMPQNGHLISQSSKIPTMVALGEQDPKAPISRIAGAFKDVYLTSNMSFSKNLSDIVDSKMLLVLKNFGSDSFYNKTNVNTGLLSLQLAFLNSHSGVELESVRDGFVQLVTQTKRILTPYYKALDDTAWNICPVAQKMLLTNEIDSFPLKNLVSFSPSNSGPKISFYSVRESVRDYASADQNSINTEATVITAAAMHTSTSYFTGTAAPVDVSCSMMSRVGFESVVGTNYLLNQTKPLTCADLQATLVSYAYSMLTKQQKDDLKFVPVDHHLNITVASQDTFKIDASLNKNEKTLNVYMSEEYREGRSYFGFKKDKSRDSVKCRFVPPARLVEVFITL